MHQPPTCAELSPLHGDCIPNPFCPYGECTGHWEAAVSGLESRGLLCWPQGRVSSSRPEMCDQVLDAQRTGSLRALVEMEMEWSSPRQAPRDSTRREPGPQCQPTPSCLHTSLLVQRKTPSSDIPPASRCGMLICPVSGSFPGRSCFRETFTFCPCCCSSSVSPVPRQAWHQQVLHKYGLKDKW